MNVFVVVDESICDQPDANKVYVECPIHILDVVGYKMFILFFELVDNLGIVVIVSLF